MKGVEEIPRDWTGGLIPDKKVSFKASGCPLGLGTQWEPDSADHFSVKWDLDRSQIAFVYCLQTSAADQGIKWRIGQDLINV